VIFILFGILGTLIQFAVIGGVIYLIVRLVSKRDRSTSESVGVVLRRFFVYTIMLTMLMLSGIGVSGLIDAAWPESNELAASSSQIAISISFVIVALPVYVGLGVYTRRQLRTDPNEQRSMGWAFYLTAALIGSLFATMALSGTLLSDLVGGDDINRSTAIHIVVWASIWGGHWLVAQRRQPERIPQVHLLLGSAIALAWTFTGAFSTLNALLRSVYDGLSTTTIVSNGGADILRPATVLLVGLPVWWWYWFRNTRTSDRTPWWLAYVLLLGVLGGAVSVITGAGVAAFGVLDWFLGDPGTGAAVHFRVIPGSATGILVGGSFWLYHTRVLGDRDETSRSEVGRVYDHLLSGAGLVVAASGVSTLISTTLIALSGAEIASRGAGSALAAAIALILIGAPLWWRYWNVIQKASAADPEEELQSITRRIYIVVIFGAAAVTAVISLITIVFMVFEDLLEGTLGFATLGSAAIPAALLVTAGVLGWYHLAVFREDRAAATPFAAKTPSADERIASSVVPRGSLEETLRALAESGHPETTVLWSEGGYEVEPINAGLGVGTTRSVVPGPDEV